MSIRTKTLLVSRYPNVNTIMLGPTSLGHTLVRIGVKCLPLRLQFLSVMVRVGGYGPEIHLSSMSCGTSLCTVSDPTLLRIQRE